MTPSGDPNGIRGLASHTLFYTSLGGTNPGDLNRLMLFVSDRPPCDECNGVGVKEGTDGKWTAFEWTLRMTDAQGLCDLQ